MQALSKYAAQSVVTDPGKMVWWLADLPTEVPALRRIAQGLVVHYRTEDLSALGIPGERMEEIDTRYAEPMLERLFTLDDRPLIEPRPPETRLVGCCRDFTVLFLSLLRHQEIPARARVGFATYFVPGWNVDHEVAEVWDATVDRWRLVDAELDDMHVDSTDKAPLDALDLPRDRFLLAGDAWRSCRSGDANPERFLVDPGLEIADTRGWPYLRHNLIHDLATLNNRELLLWDSWGLMETASPSEADLELLDRVAETTRLSEPAVATVQALYEGEPGLRVPPTVTSYSPATSEPQRVQIVL